ncbi:MAG TPA: hypothetical protein VFV70_15890 [Hyphomonadaceae bacterium]|nr:hypothetical protein [Hyphomonadaceae bacterium]
MRFLLYIMPSLWLGAAVAGGALGQDNRPQPRAQPGAQASTKDRVQAVVPGADAKALTETGRISAAETMTYTIDAKSGHSASVNFRANNAKCGFVIYGPRQTPGANAPMFDSAASGNQFSGFLPATGQYLVRIALTREAARNMQTCDYTITFAVAR